jgi:hypothetical protein
MKLSYEHIGFIMEGELLIKKIGDSNFILLPEEFGMFYVFPDATLKIKIECKLCGTEREMAEETTLLLGNERVLGLLQCDICKSHTLVIFKVESVKRLVRELGISTELIIEHWGYAMSLSSN